MFVRSGLGQYPEWAVEFGASQGAGVVSDIAAKQATGRPSWCSWMPFGSLFDACNPSPPAPPAPRVPPVSMTEAPASGEEAAAAVQAVTNQQITDWQAALQRFYNSLSVPAGTGEPSWWDTYGSWLILGVLGIAVWKVAKG